MKEVIRLVLGNVFTNTYILKEADHCIIIDPAANPKRILKEVEGLCVDAICLTHGHFDHIQAVDPLVKQLHCDVYISEDDEEMLRDSKKNASVMAEPFTVKAAVSHYQPVTKIGPFEFEVIEASGHTKGSVLLLIDDLMFCGDVLFKEGIGRCDLYGGSFSQMKATLKKIAKIDKDYKIYCGHGENTTLFEEFKNNPYLKEL
ncbi:MBL fold metallo-hydrolase [uncultured Traorella sp.]|uniref:MBL fold metallo-hydrolase n=1 Tax=uncultured Traorella sp. TaxID=1929048 RepID=UPI0025EE4031|nr:MBL fold metallo-hydrolase [uncultured Traorella sp.]